MSQSGFTTVDGVYLTPVAEREIEKAYLWYRKRNPAFVDHIVSEIDEYHCQAARKTTSWFIGD